MEFLSPKTKERIAKLEADNKSLRSQLEQQDNTGKSPRWPFHSNEPIARGSWFWFGNLASHQ